MHDVVAADWLANPELFTATPIQRSEVPPALQPWVDLQASMTAELAEHFGQQPTVRVHSSGPGTLLAWEADCLHAGNARDGYARHISLNVGATAVLIARSVTPAGSTVQPLLSELQQTPLARVLFEDPRWQRIGGVLPLITATPHIGRACAWQDQDSGDTLVVEEFFLFLS